MGWLKLTVSTGADHVNAVGELLEQFGAASLSYAPVTGEAVFDSGGGEAVFWEQTAVTALLDEETDLDILIACLRNRAGDGNIHGCEVAPLREEDWMAVHRRDHGPLVYGDSLCVCPTWSTPPAQAHPVIRLDPGLAFGSGSHPTTCLCLEWLARANVQGTTVIDYGCGAGVLGLAALALGADRVYAVDIDDQALAATRDNAARNSLSAGLEIGPPESLAGVGADILLANILLAPLLELAPRLTGLVAAGGSLVLSGLLAQQADDCLAAYQPWFKMEAPRFNQEWAMICGTRRTDPD